MYFPSTPTLHPTPVFISGKVYDLILDQTQLVDVHRIQTELETCKHKLEQCKDELKDLREEWAREKDNLKGELEELYKLMIEERKNMNDVLEVERANTEALGQYLSEAIDQKEK